MPKISKGADQDVHDGVDEVLTRCKHHSEEHFEGFTRQPRHMKERRGIAIFVETAPGRESWVEQGLTQQVRPLTNVIIVPAADYNQQKELLSEASMMGKHHG